MRRRWSNNGGFHSLRMLEESSSEVTSSSALGFPPAMVMSPESLASPEYGGLELWGYDDGISYNSAQSLLSNTCNMQQQQQPTQPLPPMPLPMPPTTPKSENESISSGQGRTFLHFANFPRVFDVSRILGILSLNEVFLNCSSIMCIAITRTLSWRNHN